MANMFDRGQQLLEAENALQRGGAPVRPATPDPRQSLAAQLGLPVDETMMTPEMNQRLQQNQNDVGRQMFLKKLMSLIPSR